jgi:hypothetical protein
LGTFWERALPIIELRIIFWERWSCPEKQVAECRSIILFSCDYGGRASEARGGRRWKAPPLANGMDPDLVSLFVFLQATCPEEAIPSQENLADPQE